MEQSWTACVITSIALLYEKLLMKQVTRVIEWDCSELYESKGTCSLRRSILILLFLVGVMVSNAPDAWPGTIRRPEKLSHKRLTRLLGFTPKMVFYGGCMIAEGQNLEGPVVVIAGTLDIQDGGVLHGDVWVINGKLILTGRAVIDGNVNLVNSSDYTSHEAFITGEIMRYRSESKLDDKRFEEEGIVEFIEYRNPKEVRSEFSIGGNSSGRVGYLSVMLRTKRENDFHKDPYIKGKGWVGVSPFKRSTNLIAFDADYSIPLTGRKLELLIHGFSRAFNNDKWMLSERENSFILLMTGDDFFDYWEKSGGEIGLRFKHSEKYILEALVSYQREQSLEANPRFSILYPTNKYRVNPSIDDGDRLAVSGRLILDTRVEEAWRENAWLASLWVEKGIADGPGDFSYTAFDIDIRRYNFLPWNMRFDIRGKLFSSFTSIPGQLTRSLNGYSGIRGLSDLPFGAERGDRLALFSFELRRGLPEIPVFNKIFSRWDFLLFSDIGFLTRAKNNEAPFRFLNISFDEWKKTVGIGISGESLVPYLALYVAQDLDADRIGPRIILRFNRSF